jgi:hypothetical protein
VPTLLAETIMQTVVTNLAAGLSGVQVLRGRVDRLPAARLPVVAVFQGPDEPQEESAWPFLTSLLEVRTAVADDGASEAAVEAALNDLRRRVHALLMTADPLGLAYVVDVIPGGADEPDLSGDADRITGSMVVRWGIHYRHRYDDAGEAP